MDLHLLSIFSDLSTSALVVFFLCILAVAAFEFVNGFHDTANAVATVIYTRSLPAVPAVVWSGIWNFLGVWAGGIGVAMGIINMLPLNDLVVQSVWENVALVISILVTSIMWNLYTWYYGIPCSSSHTLIGSLLGAAYGFYQINGGEGIRWAKTGEIGLSLLLSPLFGFGVVYLLMILLQKFIKNKTLFSEPDPEAKTPTWIRAILITTCTLVSFFHGSNDGQKGVGLMLVILLAFIPAHFAINEKIPVQEVHSALVSMERTLVAHPNAATDVLLPEIREAVALTNPSADQGSKGKIRLRIVASNLLKAFKKLDKEGAAISPEVKAAIGKEQLALKNLVEFSPTWVVVLISLSLGLGTMIGWKRIVVTIGEKIGKTHLTYAQGAMSEIVAASTIGLSTGLHLPVSTTHVLSSGVAGSMVAMDGVKNLQRKTLVNIAMAWVLTLPVTLIGSWLFYHILHYFISK